MFVAQTGLTWRLAVDLLDKMNNPDNHQPYSEVDDDDLEVTSRFTVTLRVTEDQEEVKADDIFIWNAESDKLKPAPRCRALNGTNCFNYVAIRN